MPLPIRTFSLDEDHTASHAGRSRQWAIARQQDTLEHLRERDVHGIVRREVLAQFPHALQQRLMGMPVQVQRTEIVQRHLGSRSVDLALSHVTP